MRTLPHTLKTRWLLIALAVGVAVAAIAIIAGANFGLRTSGGATSAPTDEEWDAAIATAVAKSARPLGVVEMVDSATGKPVEDSPAVAISKEELAFEEAYETADAKYPLNFWPHVYVSPKRLTPHLQEYLNTHPDRAIYLRTIDRVVHLPENVGIRWVQRGVFPPYECAWGDPEDWCPTWPSYDIALNVTDEPDRRKRSVTVDSTGVVSVGGSDTLPDGFSFLSQFKVERDD